MTITPKGTNQQAADLGATPSQTGGTFLPELPSADRLYYAGLAYRILRMAFVIVFLPIALGLLLIPIAGILALIYVGVVYAYLKWCEACTRMY